MVNWLCCSTRGWSKSHTEWARFKQPALAPDHSAANPLSCSSIQSYRTSSLPVSRGIWGFLVPFLSDMLCLSSKSLRHCAAASLNLRSPISTLPRAPIYVFLVCNLPTHPQPLPRTQQTKSPTFKCHKSVSCILQCLQKIQWWRLFFGLPWEWPAWNMIVEEIIWFFF